MIPNEVLKAVKGRFNTGESFKIKHKQRLDGSTCTPSHKDPAMTVTRKKNGWVFYCHRCMAGGAVPDKKLTPNQTKEKLKTINQQASIKSEETIDLPEDFIQLNKSDVKHILWGLNIFSNHWELYDIGYSESFKRIIVPLYDYDAPDGTKLVGWVGRDTSQLTKEARKKSGIHKWIIRSLKGNRRYFVAPGDDKNIILVEDSFSAMRVSTATGMTAIALLNNSVSDDLYDKLRSAESVYLWLDSDMFIKSLNTVNRLRQLGINVKHVYTKQDPKEYADKEILETINAKS